MANFGDITELKSKARSRSLLGHYFLVQPVTLALVALE